MTGYESILVKILDVVAHGTAPLFNEQTLLEKTGLKKVDFEKIINEIETGTKPFVQKGKITDPYLYKAVTKSLALLTMDLHGHADVQALFEQPLPDILAMIWGKPVTTDEYFKIMNQ
jgi:hypothetical protein